MPLTAIYPNLKLLEEKGLIKSFGADVKRYEVIAPRIALKHLAEKQSANLFVLQDKLAPKLHRLKEQRLVKEPDPVELFSGAKASLDLSFSLLEQAKSSFYVVGWGFRKQKSLHRAVKLFRLLGEKNINARIIFGDDNQRTRFLASKCVEFGVQARFYPLENFSLVMADNAQCKVTLKRKDLSEQVNMHISDADLVSAFSHYALMLWEKSSLFE
ncbi:hypothetical protein K9M74_01055 [Candidatus Woesearchaeota archaeon]|nr:hypothetical protein [Candidatus Woesearchaeota archaeon]